MIEFLLSTIVILYLLGGMTMATLLKMKGYRWVDIGEPPDWVLIVFGVLFWPVVAIWVREN